MTKDEFLDTLREALTDSVPSSVVRENIQYYGDYIDEQEQKGLSEEQVLEELGSPRLIAHTIIDTTPGAGEGYAREGRGNRAYNSRSQGRREDDRPSSHSFNLDLGKWYWRIILYIVLVFVIFMVISVVSGLLGLLLPVLPVIVIVAVMMMMFGGHGR